MVNIAILGFGVVGSAVYELAEQNAKHLENKAGERIRVKKILDVRKFDKHSARELFVSSIDDVLSDSAISVVVETIGGLHPAYEYTKAALLHGKSVVTSNKELVATHGKELCEIAKQKNVSYLFEASVGGGIPIIRPLKQCLVANEISEVFGILNGTSNFILTQMCNEGKSFAEALAEAQSKGYAEKNPAADVEGHDACRKINILAWTAFGKLFRCEDIAVKGISDINVKDLEQAKADGCVIKLIGRAKVVDGKLCCSVAPEVIPISNPLAMVDGVNNAIIVRGNFIGDAMFYGQGAGGAATASAVMGDVIEIVLKQQIRIEIKENIKNAILQYA